jgi:hypothetical protein
VAGYLSRPFESVGESEGDLVENLSADPLDQALVVVSERAIHCIGSHEQQAEKSTTDDGHSHDQFHEGETSGSIVRVGK